jgi:sec-independent protein translocase protein TatC
MSDVKQPNPFPHEAEMPFLDHLDELRSRLIWSLLAVGVGTVVGFVLVTQFDVLGLLIAPIQPFLHGSKLKYLNPTDPLFITLKLALLVGFLLALPIVVHQIWSFLSPALLPSERRVIIPSLYFGLVLFVVGMVMAYTIVLPITLEFTMGFQTASLEQSIVISEYLKVVTRLLLAFGLVFELPIVIVVLSVLGLVTPEFLAAKRRHAIVGITVLSSLITPGDVVAVTILMMIPLILLYEMSIFLSRVITRRRALAHAAVEG